MTNEKQALKQYKDKILNTESSMAMSEKYFEQIDELYYKVGLLFMERFFNKTIVGMEDEDWKWKDDFLLLHYDGAERCFAFETVKAALFNEHVTTKMLIEYDEHHHMDFDEFVDFNI